MASSVDEFLDNPGSLVGLGGKGDGSGWLSLGGKGSLVIVGLAAIGLTIGIIAYLVWRHRRNKDKGKMIRTIRWYRTVGERLLEREETDVEEIVLPGSGIRFLWDEKSRNWWPRFVEESNMNTFNVAIAKTGELINFTIKPIEPILEQAGIQYDHRDMLSQNIHLGDIIDEDYTKKSKPWWQEYKDLIATIAIIFVMAIALGIIVYFLTGALTQIKEILAQQNGFQKEQLEVMKEIVNTVKEIKATSGIYST